MLISIVALLTERFFELDKLLILSTKLSTYQQPEFIFNVIHFFHKVIKGISSSY